MKITFLLPVVSHARFRKRVTALENLGVQPKILAFERDDYPGKPWPGGYTSLGKLQRRNYHKRLLPHIKAFPAVLDAAKESDVIYAFSLDSLLLGWLASRALDKRLRIVYEVGDIRKVLTEDSLLSRSLRWLERHLLRHVDLLVVTSEAYIVGYYQGILGLTDLQYQVIENKLDMDTLPQQVSTRKKRDGILRIGYFGFIRCRRSWEILKRVAEKGHGRVRVYVRGVPKRLEDFEEEARRAPYVEYGGPYIAPDDLPAMYGQVDMEWACFPYRGNGIGNWRWARTNRFYEACFFQRPMFAQKGTEDCRAVESLGIGVCLDLKDLEGTVDRILRVNESELALWQQNLTGLPRNVYVYSDEHNRLMESIQCR